MYRNVQKVVYYLSRLPSPVYKPFRPFPSKNTRSIRTNRSVIYSGRDLGMSASVLVRISARNNRFRELFRCITLSNFVGGCTCIFFCRKGDPRAAYVVNLCGIREYSFLDSGYSCVRCQKINTCQMLLISQKKRSHGGKQKYMPILIWIANVFCLGTSKQTDKDCFVRVCTAKRRLLYFSGWVIVGKAVENG